MKASACLSITTLNGGRRGKDGLRKHTGTRTSSCVKQLVGGCCIAQGAQPSTAWWPIGVERRERRHTHIYIYIYIYSCIEPTQHCKTIFLQQKNKFKKYKWSKFSNQEAKDSWMDLKKKNKTPTYMLNIRDLL